MSDSYLLTYPILENAYICSIIIYNLGYKRHLTFLIVCFVFLIKIKAQYPFYYNYNINNGLLSNRIYNIIEDRNGFIWACTEQGVSRFDGINFTNFTTKQGLPDNEVLSVFEDAKGRIWFNNFNKEPSYYYNGKIFNSSNDPFLERIRKFKPKGMSIFVLVQKSNTIGFYIQENNKRLIISKDAPELEFKYHSDVPDFFHYILLEKDNTFELRSICESFAWKKGDSAHQTNLEYDKNTQNYIHAPINYLNWLNNSQHYVVQIDIKTGDSTAIKIDERYKNIFLSADYTIITGDSFYSVYNPKVSILRETVKLPFNFERVFIDKKGNKWIGSFDNGIYFIRKNAPISIGLPTEKTKGLSNLWTQDGNLFVATETNGLLVINSKGKIVKNVIGPKINRVRAYGCNAKYKFLGVDNGLFIMDHDYKNLRMLREISMKDIENGENGELLFGTASCAFILYNNSDDKLIRICRERTTAVCRKNKNEIWLGGLAGVRKCVLTDTGYLNTDLKLNNLIDNSRIVDIKRDELGNMWVATDQKGLFYCSKEGKIVHFSEFSNFNHHLLSDVCLQIAIGQNNKIWLATTNGISVIEYLNSISPTFKVTSYSIPDGMPAKKINSIAFWNGKLIVCANNGLFYFNNLDAPKNEIYNTIITQIKVNSILYQGDNLELDYNHNNLIISYISSFINTSLNYHFQYRIKEISTAWIQTNNLEVPLLGMEPGTYTFEIAALNDNGNTGKISTLNFTIARPWYKHWWVVLIGLLLFVGSVFYYFKLMKERVVLSKDLTLLRLRILRAQMNPHFVFNALSNIKHLVKIKQLENAEKYIGTLSLIMRKSINYSAKEFIQLNKEINYTKDYIEIELLRFGEKFKVEFQFDLDEEDLQAIFVPPLIIQPVAENAIKHAFKGLNYQGVLKIVVVKLNANFIKYSIIDNGRGFDVANNTASNHGLSITKERILILFKDIKNKGSVTIKSEMKGPQTGTHIEIILPILND